MPQEMSDAERLEGAGDHAAAAGRYQDAAERFEKQKPPDIELAVKCWDRAARAAEKKAEEIETKAIAAREEETRRGKSELYPQAAVWRQAAGDAFMHILSITHETSSATYSRRAASNYADGADDLERAASMDVDKEPGEAAGEYSQAADLRMRAMTARKDAAKAFRHFGDKEGAAAETSAMEEEGKAMEKDLDNANRLK